MQDRRTSSSAVTLGGKTDKSITGAAESKQFSDCMQQQQKPEWDKGLQELLQKLDEIGKKLAASFSIYDLKMYKDALRQFLEETYGKVYQIKEEKTWANKGKSRVYQIIEKIDSELEEMSRLVISKQKDQTKLLAKIDEIRGLMVDLYS